MTRFCSQCYLFDFFFFLLVSGKVELNQIHFQIEVLISNKHLMDQGCLIMVDCDPRLNLLDLSMRLCSHWIVSDGFVALQAVVYLNLLKERSEQQLYSEFVYIVHDNPKQNYLSI